MKLLADPLQRIFTALACGRSFKSGDPEAGKGTAMLWKVTHVPFAVPVTQGHTAASTQWG